MIQPRRLFRASSSGERGAGGERGKQAGTHTLSHRQGCLFKHRHSHSLFAARHLTFLFCRRHPASLSPSRSGHVRTPTPPLESAPPPQPPPPPPHPEHHHHHQQQQQQTQQQQTQRQHKPPVANNSKATEEDTTRSFRDFDARCKAAAAAVALAATTTTRTTSTSEEEHEERRAGAGLPTTRDEGSGGPDQPRTLGAMRAAADDEGVIPHEPRLMVGAVRV